MAEYLQRPSFLQAIPAGHEPRPAAFGQSTPPRLPRPMVHHPGRAQ